MAKCIIALLLFCQNLGQIGSVVQEKQVFTKSLDFEFAKVSVSSFQSQQPFTRTQQVHLNPFTIKMWEQINHWLLSRSYLIIQCEHFNFHVIYKTL